VIAMTSAGRAVLFAGATVDPAGDRSVVERSAALIASTLVPSTMELLGDRNWWIPAWLDRLLPHLAIDGEPLVHSTAKADSASVARAA
jgi:putative drug exporter of the RND superfamily